MPLVRINADGDRAVPLDDLGAALEGLPPDTPVIALIHGYKYDPDRVAHCPHRQILSLDPRMARRAISWPKHLGFGRGDAAEGLCLAFGWNARGTIWHAHAEAARAGRALAAVLRTVHAARRAPVHLVSHSLGARVAMQAMEDLPPRTIGRALLLAAAETRASAERAMATDAGRTAEIVNVQSRENTVFDLLFRTAIHPHRPFAPTLGAGFGRNERRWLDLPIDCSRTRAHLAAQGFRIPPPARAICHWSAYLRPGLFPLYRALLREGLPLAALRETLAAGHILHPLDHRLAR